MLPVSLVLVVAVGYLGLLFLIASRGERRAGQQQRPRPWRYSLALGVHCTTWAFYGTVTQAAHYGWWLAPTYAGGILTFLAAHQLQMKLLKVVKKQNLTSIADLFGSRYYKAHGLAALVAILCLLALIPYLALQLRAVTASFAAVTGLDSGQVPWFSDVAAVVALTMIAFSIIFGARRLSLSEQHPGLMDVIAFESVVKLVAFAVVGWFSVYVLFDGLSDLFLQAAANPLTQGMLQGVPNGAYVYITHMLLGALAMFVLPRQFQVNFIENTDPEELKTARWAFPVYLLAINFFILPIALAGGILVPEQISADTFMLALPVLADRPDISLVAFVGGLSAATSMVLMATLALSIMMSNDVLTPLWLRLKGQAQGHVQVTPGTVLTIRRLTIVLIITLAYVYHTLTEAGVALVTNGLIAMALLAQLAPGMLVGLVWRRGNAAGAAAGLIAGTLAWVWWLLLPSLMSTGTDSRLAADLAISQGVMLSLGLNLLFYTLFSWFWRDHPAAREAAINFVSPATQPQPDQSPAQVTWGRLRQTLARFIDDQDARQLDERLGITLAAARPDALVASQTLHQIERELAGMIGSAASRLVFSALIRHSEVPMDEVVDWASEASQMYRFNRELLQASVENIPQGISVIDKDLRLVAWNRRYLQLFRYPDGFIQAGMPVADLLRYNAERGLFGAPGKGLQRAVQKRLEYLRAGSAYRYQREQSDGRTLELQGNPMPDGGFVTTYTDITELVEAQSELQRMNLELEQRVAQRTGELEEAKQAAEYAHASKSRFFAAAGHDLMQPFNAASLFCEMLVQRLSGSQQDLARQIQHSLDNAEELLTMLLEMTRLESGRVQPDPQPVVLTDLLTPLLESFVLLAREKGIELRWRLPEVTVQTDKKLLQRVVQNLLSNAVRYTESGKILCGVRRRGAELELQVLDTGPGIPVEQQQEIFREFHQLEQSEHNPGLGLGLAIVAGMCRLLDTHIKVYSEPGRGTCFSLRLPLTDAAASNAARSGPEQQTPLLPAGLPVLVMDNDPAILKALSSLLENWGARVQAVSDLAAAEALPEQPALLLVDYHLDEGRTGIEAIRALRAHWQNDIPAIICTADPDERVREEVVEVQAMFLSKPVKQAAMKRLLRRILSQ